MAEPIAAMAEWAILSLALRRLVGQRVRPHLAVGAGAFIDEAAVRMSRLPADW